MMILLITLYHHIHSVYLAVILIVSVSVAIFYHSYECSLVN